MVQPRYVATRTLLGGEPDVNRRIIRDRETGREVCVFNQGMDTWSAEDERLLEIVVTALNREAG
jgi:hypothetical protein